MRAYLFLSHSNKGQIWTMKNIIMDNRMNCSVVMVITFRTNAAYKSALLSLEYNQTALTLLLNVVWTVYWNAQDVLVEMPRTIAFKWVWWNSYRVMSIVAAYWIVVDVVAHSFLGWQSEFSIMLVVEFNHEEVKKGRKKYISQDFYKRWWCTAAPLFWHFWGSVGSCNEGDQESHCLMLSTN